MHGTHLEDEAVVQDKDRSDSMDPACDAAKMHGLLRRAVALMKGLEITLTPRGFTFAVISVIPVLKISERCALLLEAML